jgi:hypothetical protein
MSTHDSRHIEQMRASFHVESTLHEQKVGAVLNASLKRAEMNTVAMHGPRGRGFEGGNHRHDLAVILKGCIVA